MRATRVLLLALAFASTLSFMSCAETAGSGAPVPAPSVTINCTTAHCRTNSTPNIFVTITASGCLSQFKTQGTVASVSTSQITCNGTSGCQGQISSGWLNKDGISTSTVPSGTYSVCGYACYSGSCFQMGDTDSGSSAKDLDNVTINASSGALTLSNWRDN